MNTAIPPLNTLVQFVDVNLCNLWLVGANELPGPIQRVELSNPTQVNIAKFRVLQSSSDDWVYLQSNDVNFAYPVVQPRPYLYTDPKTSLLSWTATEFPPNNLTTLDEADFQFNLVVCDSLSSCTLSSNTQTSHFTLAGTRYALSSKGPNGPRFLYVKTCSPNSTSMLMLTDSEAMSLGTYTKLWFKVVNAGLIPDDPAPLTGTTNNTPAPSLVSSDWMWATIALIIFDAVIIVFVILGILFYYSGNDTDVAVTPTRAKTMAQTTMQPVVLAQ